VDVVLGYDDIAGYEAGTSCFGAFVGRYANRIKDAAFELNGRRYQLEKNDGENHLHGTFIRTVFDIREQEDGLRLSHTFPDGEEGYPGSLQVVAFYRLMEYNCLELDYYAKSDADTVINLTNHSYFDLSGCGRAMEQTLCIHAERYLELGAGTLPTGQTANVSGTPFDFLSPKPVGRDLGEDDEQLRLGGGYDHNFCLSGHLAAELESSVTGIRMEVFTTMPGMQLYTANFATDDRGKDGASYVPREAVCLEPGIHPDAIHHPEWPSPVFSPERPFLWRMRLEFSTAES
jgi:aldose 1-epimerase